MALQIRAPQSQRIRNSPIKGDGYRTAQLSSSSVVCADCMKGKQRRDSIPRKSQWRASQRLQLVHADIYGPITPVSNSRKRYTLCLIDDFSRKMWTYFLFEKSETLYFFKFFKAMVEKETGLPIKCLRTDRGGKFNSIKFNQFCKMHGIQRQLTTAYTPQQNGVAERKNRTVMNLVRSMLSGKRIPKTFWAEAVRLVVYVMNRSPTVAVDKMTLEEAWSGKMSSMDHFRIFECIGHVHVPDAKRTKLEDKSMKCVLFGVSSESKGYRLYDPTTDKIVVSRDVVFEEESQWDWDARHEKEQLMDLEWEDNNSVECDEEACEAEGEREGLKNGNEEASLSDADREGLNSKENKIRNPPRG